MPLGWRTPKACTMLLVNMVQYISLCHCTLGQTLMCGCNAVSDTRSSPDSRYGPRRAVSLRFPLGAQVLPTRGENCQVLFSARSKLGGRLGLFIREARQCSRRFGLRRVPCLARLTCCGSLVMVKTEDRGHTIRSVRSVLVQNLSHKGPSIHSLTHSCRE